MSESVKRRKYDSSGRRQKAEATRAAVLAEARRQFLADGYAATSVSSIAEAVGVSVETIYKSMGPKAAIVRALWEQGLAGRGPVPAPSRSDALPDTAEELVSGWANLVKEVAPLASPLSLLVKEAAAHDADMAELLEEIDDERRARMRHNAKRLVGLPGARADLTLASVTDILWLYTAPEMYDVMVHRGRWSIGKYAAFIGDALQRQLLVQRE
ncbi:MAG: TetR/AcrR family transcriptional regulator [Marmoricola sp.]